EAAVRDSYHLLGEGYDSVYLDTLAHDTRLVLIGVGPDDILLGYDAGAAAARRLFGEEEYELVSKDLEVHVAEDGCCAWVHDDLSHRVLRGHRRATIPLRMTAAYERREGRWVKVLEHVSYGIADAEAVARATPVKPSFPSETMGG